MASSWRNKRHSWVIAGGNVDIQTPSDRTHALRSAIHPLPSFPKGPGQKGPRRVKIQEPEQMDLTVWRRLELA
ncbi:hypothetical protein COMA2_10176 [Candidatus Nitrospira nitrificans]|uniref:Uncharacterized protein n=1 Tax=Candidatus Nitrospira nitrificans TaxID=1742973 RepID=A0A0S4L462_9BACT|nr:hypothetical protein COMA2_10176 [Candidatus Nitrospira nitrificans]